MLVELILDFMPSSWRWRSSWSAKRPGAKLVSR
jgi:hypothetical protein